MDHPNFNEYLQYLRESMDNLHEFGTKAGRKNMRVELIRRALKHSDPFILYKASIAATLVLKDKSIYH